MVEYKMKVPAGFVEVSVLASSTSTAPSTAPLTITFEMTGKSLGFGMVPGNKIQIPVTPGKVKVHASYGMLTSATVELDVAAGETKSVVFEFGPS